MAAGMGCVTCAMRCDEADASGGFMPQFGNKVRQPGTSQAWMREREREEREERERLGMLTSEVDE